LVDLEDDVIDRDRLVERLARRHVLRELDEPDDRVRAVALLDVELGDAAQPRLVVGDEVEELLVRPDELRLVDLLLLLELLDQEAELRRRLVRPVSDDEELRELLLRVEAERVERETRAVSLDRLVGL